MSRATASSVECLVCARPLMPNPTRLACSHIVHAHCAFTIARCPVCDDREVARHTAHDRAWARDDDTCALLSAAGVTPDAETCAAALALERTQAEEGIPELNRYQICRSRGGGAELGAELVVYVQPLNSARLTVHAHENAPVSFLVLAYRAECPDGWARATRITLVHRGTLLCPTETLKSAAIGGGDTVQALYWSGAGDKSSRKRRATSPLDGGGGGGGGGGSASLSTWQATAGMSIATTQQTLRDLSERSRPDAHTGGGGGGGGGAMTTTNRVVVTERRYAWDIGRRGLAGELGARLRVSVRTFTDRDIRAMTTWQHAPSVHIWIRMGYYGLYLGTPTSCTLPHLACAGRLLDYTRTNEENQLRDGDTLDVVFRLGRPEQLRA